MTLVKGPNGLVVDVAPTIASGLIGGGYVEAVETKNTATTSAADEEDLADPNKPSGNASRGDWEAYALAQGFAEEQLDGLKRDEIRALFDE